MEYEKSVYTVQKEIAKELKEKQIKKERRQQH
jgi:hypothetical protein